VIKAPGSDHASELDSGIPTTCSFADMSASRWHNTAMAVILAEDGDWRIEFATLDELPSDAPRAEKQRRGHRFERVLEAIDTYIDPVY
jgi:hypothetical protein